MGSELVGGRHQFFSEKHFYFCFLQPYFQRQNTSMSTHLHCLPTSSSIFLYICFLSLYTVESPLLCQRTLRWGLSSLVSVSSPWSGVRRIFRWLLGFSTEILICKLVLVRNAQRIRGWSGGAMVLGKLLVPGRPTNLDYSKARAHCACSWCGWGLFGYFSLIYHFSFLSPFLEDGPI